MIGAHSVVMVTQFFPRGGSAQVVRSLSRGLTSRGWTVGIVSGSAGQPQNLMNARAFYSGQDVYAFSYARALKAHARGEDPYLIDTPMQPSFEYEATDPDRFLGRIPPDAGDLNRDSWIRFFRAAGIATPKVFHLHHLGPFHEAVAALWPTTQRVVHLHGTELAFLESAAGADSPARYEPYSRYWARRLTAHATHADCVIVVSEADRRRAIRLLGLDESRVKCVPNGVDVRYFQPRRITRSERASLLRYWLVDNPRGWHCKGLPGTIRYSGHDLRPLLRTGVVTLMFVGRFTAAKRLRLLVTAYHRAQPFFNTPACLLVWGGYPGEPDTGIHPASLATELGIENVYFVGWRGHDDLRHGLNITDALVTPSVGDAFPQTALEAMATGVPVVGAQSGGFSEMINRSPGRPDGWLVPPDDIEALAETLVRIVNNRTERRVRARSAYQTAQEQFSWEQRLPLLEAAYRAAESDRVIDQGEASDGWQSRAAEG